MGKKTKKIILTALKLLLAAAALVFVFSQIELRKVLEIYGRSNLFFILLALIFFIASKTVSAYRLNLFFFRAGLPLPHPVNLRLYLLGMFYNLFLPGGIGGDGYKIYLLQKNYKTGTKKLLGAVLTDRISGMSALMILALVLFSSLDLPIPYHTYGFLLIPFVLAGVYLFMKVFYEYFLKAFWITLFFSFGVQLLQLICVWMILIALGIHENILSYLLVFLASSIVALLPVSIGGIGLRELTFLYGTKWLGIVPEIGVSVSLMFYLITALVSLAGLYFVIRPVKMSDV